MQNKLPGTGPNSSPILIITSTVGVFFGLFSGINHGVFEILQGNRDTNGYLINAIGEAHRFWPGGTEPAFTLIPNYLFTGIAAVLVGVAIVIWSIWFIPTRHGEKVFLGLFILSFLVGGGIGQAFFFLPAWAFATQIGKPLGRWRRLLPRVIWLYLARFWSVFLVLATTVMLIGVEMAIFGYFPRITDTEALMNINMGIVFGSALLFILSFLAGLGHDLLLQEPANAVSARHTASKGEFA